MVLKCYVCGAFPNNPNKDLDTLKLIKCLDCGNVACIKHRDGIVGGKCAACGSERSAIAAFKQGNYDGKISGPASGGGGGIKAPAGSSNTSINKNTLKGMKKLHSNISSEIKAHQEKEAAQIAKEQASIPKEDSSELKNLLGSSTLIMGAVGTIAADAFKNKVTDEHNPHSNDDFYEKEQKQNPELDIKIYKYKLTDITKNIESVIGEKAPLKEALIPYFADQFFIDEELLKINLFTNVHIPLDNIDKFLASHPEYLSENNIEITTGFNGDELTPDLESYVEYFADLIKTKPFITGLYANFSDKNNYYNLQEQKDVILEMLDIAYENHLRFFMKPQTEEHLNLWKEIFEEFDLSDIEFIFTSPVKDEETINFIKENNIKILIKPDSEMDYYIEHLEDYKQNFILGAGDELISLLESIKHITKIEKNFHQLLLKKTEHD